MLGEIFDRISKEQNNGRDMQTITLNVQQQIDIVRDQCKLLAELHQALNKTISWMESNPPQGESRLPQNQEYSYDSILAYANAVIAKFNGECNESV